MGDYYNRDDSTTFFVINPTIEPGDEDIPADSDIKISFADAAKIAKEQHNKKIRKIELEVEKGVVVISVRFLDGAVIDTNASTGEIVRKKSARSTPSPSSETTTDGTTTDSSITSEDLQEEFEDDGTQDMQIVTSPAPSNGSSDSTQPSSNGGGGSTSPSTPSTPSGSPNTPQTPSTPTTPTQPTSDTNKRGGASR